MFKFINVTRNGFFTAHVNCCKFTERKTVEMQNIDTICINQAQYTEVTSHPYQHSLVEGVDLPAPRFLTKQVYLPANPVQLPGAENLSKKKGKYKTICCAVYIIPYEMKSTKHEIMLVRYNYC